jgi:hypothetical protein
MIIQVIPETEQEKLNMDIVEHRGVREFMVFGNKTDNDGMLVDFHEWQGGYRYLVGSLHYFANIVDEERKERADFAKRVGKAESVQPNALELSIINDEMPVDDADLQAKLDQAVEKIDEDDDENRGED